MAACVSADRHTQSVSISGIQGIHGSAKRKLFGAPPTPEGGTSRSASMSPGGIPPMIPLDALSDFARMGISSKPRKARKASPGHSPAGSSHPTSSTAEETLDVDLMEVACGLGTNLDCDNDEGILMDNPAVPVVDTPQDGFIEAVSAALADLLGKAEHARILIELRSGKDLCEVAGFVTYDLTTAAPYDWRTADCSKCLALVSTLIRAAKPWTVWSVLYHMVLGFATHRSGADFCKLLENQHVKDELARQENGDLRDLTLTTLVMRVDAAATCQALMTASDSYGAQAMATALDAAVGTGGVDVVEAILAQGQPCTEAQLQPYMGRSAELDRVLTSYISRLV